MTKLKTIGAALLALALLCVGVLFGAESLRTEAPQSTVRQADSLIIEAADAIVPSAEAADSCSPTTSGKYALRTLNYGPSTDATYQSGPACKLTVCVPKGYMASKIGPPTCGDAANPNCGLPLWILSYTVQTGNTPAGTPTCDAYWNSASRWAPPA